LLRASRNNRNCAWTLLSTSRTWVALHRAHPLIAQRLPLPGCLEYLRNFEHKKSVFSRFLSWRTSIDDATRRASCAKRDWPPVVVMVQFVLVMIYLFLSKVDWNLMLVGHRNLLMFGSPPP
jgi:hypothetical protein